MGLEENRKKLSAALEIQKEIDRLEKGVENLKQGSISSPQYGDRVSGEVRVSDQDRLSELLGEIENKKQDQRIEKEIIKRKLNELDLEPLEFKVLTLRYVECMKWKELSRTVCYNTRHVHKVEENALNKTIFY